VVFADQLGIQQLLHYPKAVLQRHQFVVVDISGSWFSHLAKRRQAFGYHHYVLCDGLWTDFGVQHGFALCVGGSARAQQRAARFFHQLAPCRGLWLPLATAEDASFAAVLLKAPIICCYRSVRHRYITAISRCRWKWSVRHCIPS